MLQSIKQMREYQRDHDIRYDTAIVSNLFQHVPTKATILKKVLLGFIIMCRGVH